jgi:hypothetical protein
LSKKKVLQIGGGSFIPAEGTEKMTCKQSYKKEREEGKKKRARGEMRELGVDRWSWWRE